MTEEKFMARQSIEYLISLVDENGPQPVDYEMVDQSFSKIMTAVRGGAMSYAQIQETWKDLGEAFGEETMQGHGVRKPYGNAGDFEMIDRIYQGAICENPKVRRWDEYFQSRKACVAVRNRKEYFISILLEHLASEPQAKVLNIGSGPARDIFEFLCLDQGSTGVSFDCVDVDEKAIEYAKALCRQFEDHITFHRENIFKWKTDQSYSFIWSAGLFDYLADDSFVLLFRKLAKLLAPGGRLVVGNFSTRNPTRDYMEFGEWFLHHRSKKQLLELAESCDIQNCTLGVNEEAQGINLFLSLQRID